MEVNSESVVVDIPPSIFWLYTEKNVPLQHQNSRKVRSVNVMDATYSNGMMVYAPAEAKSLATFTPPIMLIIN